MAMMRLFGSKLGNSHLSKKITVEHKFSGEKYRNVQNFLI